MPRILFAITGQLQAAEVACVQALAAAMPPDVALGKPAWLQAAPHPLYPAADTAKLQQQLQSPRRSALGWEMLPTEEYDYVVSAGPHALRLITGVHTLHVAVAPAAAQPAMLWPRPDALLLPAGCALPPAGVPTGLQLPLLSVPGLPTLPPAPAEHVLLWAGDTADFSPYSLLFALATGSLRITVVSSRAAKLQATAPGISVVPLAGALPWQLLAEHGTIVSADAAISAAARACGRAVLAPADIPQGDAALLLAALLRPAPATAPVSTLPTAMASLYSFVSSL